MYRQTTTVINRTGLHARPAMEFVTLAKTFQSRLTLRSLSDPSQHEANAKSIVHVLSLGLGAGTQIELTADGPDEQSAVTALIALIDSGCGE